MVICIPRPREACVPKGCVRTNATPGCSVASDAQSRPFNGNSRSVVALTFPEMVELASSTSGAAEVTSTASDSVPTISARFNSCFCPTVSVSFATAVLKPGAEALT